jgi:hypothetical protein
MPIRQAVDSSMNGLKILFIELMSIIFMEIVMGEKGRLKNH